MYLLLCQAKEVAGTGAQAGLNVIEWGVVGAILILSVAINIFAVYKLSKVQDLRVRDQQRMSDKIQGLTEKMTAAFSGMKNSLDNLTQAEKDGQTVLQALKQSLDTVIRDAVRGARS